MTPDLTIRCAEAGYQPAFSRRSASQELQNLDGAAAQRKSINAKEGKKKKMKNNDALVTRPTKLSHRYHQASRTTMTWRRFSTTSIPHTTCLSACGVAEMYRLNQFHGVDGVEKEKEKEAAAEDRVIVAFAKGYVHLFFAFFYETPLNSSC